MYIPNLIDDRQLVVTSRLPSGYSTCPMGRGDDIAAASYGTGAPLLLSVASPTKRFQLLNHWYGTGGRVTWEYSNLDSSVGAILKAPATQGLTAGAGDYNVVGGVKIVPVATGTGTHSLDIEAKLTGTQILKCTPVPSPGNLGYFDYDSSTNALTRREDMLGGYDLYLAEIPMFRFVSHCFGRKVDGAESVFESADVVGKLLYNSWVIDFTLTPEAGNPDVRCGVVIHTATKKNI